VIVWLHAAEGSGSGNRYPNPEEGPEMGEFSKTGDKRKGGRYEEKRGGNFRETNLMNLYPGKLMLVRISLFQ